MTVRAEADPAHPAGHALIRVSGAAAALGAPGFRIQRDAGWGDDKLDPGGWQGSDALLRPDHAEDQGGDLVLYVGWAVCRHLEAGVFEFSLPAAGLAQVGLSWPDIVPLHTGAREALPPSGIRVEPRAPVSAPRPRPTVSIAPASPPPPAPAPPVETPKTAPPPASSPDILRGAIFAAVLGVLLLVAGVGTNYWQARRTTGSADGTPTAATEAAPAEIGSMTVPDVLARAPLPAITAEGERRLQSDQRDDGLLLLEAAADRSHPAAAAALARLYDPVLFQPGGPLSRPDPRQAARYYRDAARGGADVAAARAALQRDLQTRAQAGDLGANLSLKDFWP